MITNNDPAELDRLIEQLEAQHQRRLDQYNQADEALRESRRSLEAAKDRRRGYRVGSVVRIVNVPDVQSKDHDRARRFMRSGEPLLVVAVPGSGPSRWGFRRWIPESRDRYAGWSSRMIKLYVPDLRVELVPDDEVPR